jgi:hypothetical protein
VYDVKREEKYTKIMNGVALQIGGLRDIVLTTHTARSSLETVAIHIGFIQSIALKGADSAVLSFQHNR